jgi:hypothetical protein
MYRLNIIILLFIFTIKNGKAQIKVRYQGIPSNINHMLTIYYNNINSDSTLLKLNLNKKIILFNSNNNNGQIEKSSIIFNTKLSNIIKLESIKYKVNQIYNFKKGFKFLIIEFDRKNYFLTFTNDEIIFEKT